MVFLGGSPSFETLLFNWNVSVAMGQTEVCDGGADSSVYCAEEEGSIQEGVARNRVPPAAVLESGVVFASHSALRCARDCCPWIDVLSLPAGSAVAGVRPWLDLKV